jgi:hypothetical protein
MMKKIIPLNNSAYLLYFLCKDSNSKEAILIVPNSAGYFAQSPQTYGNASPRIDKFCIDLSVKFHVFYLILPGQDKENYPEAKYSYTGSISATTEAFQFVTQNHNLIGVIGMCTGAAMAVEVMEKIGLGRLPLVLYNTASSVGWSNPKGHEAFEGKYKKFVNLNHEELLANAPYSLVSIIKEHKGKMLQIASGNSDYLIEKQRKLNDQVPGIKKVEFPTMSDAPIGESNEYQPMLSLILKFFQV